MYFSVDRSTGGFRWVGGGVRSPSVVFSGPGCWNSDRGSSPDSGGVFVVIIGLD
jgi:hypothetical protein